MSDSIKDGTGGAFLAKVDSQNRLHGENKTEGFSENLAKKGHSFNFNTGTLMLSGDTTTSHLWYFKNTGDNNIILFGLVYLLGNGNIIAGDLNISVHKNPVGGTLLSNGVSKPPSNIHLGSSDALDAISLVGGEGVTIDSSEEIVFESLLAKSGQAYAIRPEVIVIPKGASFSVSIETQVGNTGMDIQIAGNLYEDA